MKLLYAVILGAIQGIAEFLPISSSGHLALFEHLLGMGDLAAMESNEIFNILLHLATLIAVIVFYWPDVRDMVVEFWNMITGRTTRLGLEPDVPMRRQILMIIIATLPCFVIVPVSDFLEGLSAYPVVIGAALIITGFLLFFADRLSRGSKTAKTITVKDALIIGVTQALATIPGLSRSGTTITAGMFCGLKREYAVKFSFLISLLSITGAVCLKFLKILAFGADLSGLPIYLVGMLIAGGVGYGSLCLLRFIVNKGKFGFFSYYCWAVGLIAILWTVFA